MTAFRCASASRARGDELAGTASTVRSYLLLEHPGPWGVEVLSEDLRNRPMPEIFRRAYETTAAQFTGSSAEVA